ncbi:MAG TPA: hypothetical protein VGW38_26020 [Chloroflexota bacterium]|nr:hypothetical protein [Chloroflexota bacterium]
MSDAGVLASEVVSGSSLLERATRVHRARHSRIFTLIYWSIIAAIIAICLRFMTDASEEGISTWHVTILPLSVTVVALLLWRWAWHRYEIQPAMLIERSHPYLLAGRRRHLHEILEAIPCRARLRLADTHSDAVLIICEDPQRALLISPRDRRAFLEDLTAADPSLRRDGEIVRRAGDLPSWLATGREALLQRYCGG